MSERVFKVAPRVPYSEQEAITKACETIRQMGCDCEGCTHSEPSDARDWENIIAQLAWANYVVPYYPAPICYECFLRMDTSIQNIVLAPRWMYVSGVPENEIHASFGTFALTGKNEKLLSLVQRWSSNPEWAFLALLSPQKGIGKTRLAISAMAQHFIDHAGVARRNEHGLLTPNVFDGYMIFTQEADIALRIRDTFGNEDNGVTEKDILDELYKAEFLVVDDLFSIKATDFNRQNVLNVLENRMNTKGKRTVFTSNFHLEDFKQIDERLFSRLSDGNKGMVININNTSMKDYRQERQEVHTL